MEINLESQRKTRHGVKRNRGKVYYGKKKIR